jgi:hypothetical protein
VLELRADEPERFGPALAALDGALEVSEQGPPPRLSPVLEYISAE